MKIMGIDPGVHKIALAVINSDKGLIYNTIIDSGKVDYGKRLSIIYRGLIDEIKRHNVSVVAVERPMFMAYRSKSIRELYMVEGAVAMAAYECMIDCQHYVTAEWRKEVFGTSRKKPDENWKKKAVETCEFWCGEKLTHDEAEAYLMALCCLKQYNKALENE